MRTTYVAGAFLAGAAIGMPGLPARVGAATPDRKAVEQAPGKSGERQNHAPPRRARAPKAAAIRRTARFVRRLNQTRRRRRRNDEEETY